MTLTGTDGRELKAKGLETRRRLLDAAERVFGEIGFYGASIVKITEAAGVAQGTFYLYFASKQEIFEELVRDLNVRVRHAMQDAAAQGRDRIEVPALRAGDIGCVAKLKNTHTNDTLSTKEHPVRLPEIAFPESVVTFAVKAVARADEEKLQQGLHRLHDEDPTFQSYFNSETHETIVGGMGERHVEVGLARVARQLDALQTTPRPHGCKKLRGTTDLWRVRVGDYRIIYYVDDRTQIIEVRAIRDRKDAYG